MHPQRNPDRLLTPGGRPKPTHKPSTRIWLVLYLVALGLIAFWPTHVDKGARPFLHWVTEMIPWLTYDRMEFTANIALFVPFGAFLTVFLSRRYLVLPIALATTVCIEVLQSLYGGQRTPDITDVIANFIGALIGLLIVVGIERHRLGRLRPRE